MVQVIDNVLSNAISFSPKGGMVQFILTADAIPRNARFWKFLMMGQGIPDTKLETVFDRFYTERPSGEGFGEHSGLGLSIARQIVDAHNGQLTAENRPEGGACFRLVLPLES
jgi:two-component system sensor histidine kinase ChvG